MYNMLKIYNHLVIYNWYNPIHSYSMTRSPIQYSIAHEI